MKHFLFIIFILFLGNYYSQVNNEKENSTPAYNNSIRNSNSNTVITAPSAPTEEYTDSLSLDEIQIQSSTKKYKAASSKMEVDSKQLKDDARSTTQSQITSNTATFSTIKQQSSTQRTQRNPSAAQQNQMNAVVESLEKNVPESFEFNYFKYVAGNYNTDLIDFLKKAETIRPNNSDVQIQMAAYYLILDDKKNALIYLEKLVSSTRLSKDVLNYAEDLLISAPDNGTLITHGFDDSYGVAYIQLSKNIRNDVTLISLDLLQSPQYKLKLKAKGFVLPAQETIDVNYLQAFCVNNELKNIAISLTTPKEYFVPIQENLFVTALVFEYHKDLAYSNYYRNDYLWNENLKKTLINSATNDKAKQLSANYLPMLLYLHRVYTEAKEMDKVKLVDEAMDKVAVQSNKYDQVQKLKSSN